jgi:hypothetical protein
VSAVVLDWVIAILCLVALLAAAALMLVLACAHRDGAVSRMCPTRHGRRR